MNLSVWFCSLTCESGLEGIRWRRPTVMLGALVLGMAVQDFRYWKDGVGPVLLVWFSVWDAVLTYFVRLTQ